MHFTLNNQETDDVSRVSKKFIFKTDFFSETHHVGNYKHFIWASCRWRTKCVNFTFRVTAHHRNRAYTHFLKVRKWLKWRNITPWVDANWRILQQCHTPLIIENWREKGSKIVKNISTHKRPFWGKKSSRKCHGNCVKD